MSYVAPYTITILSNQNKEDFHYPLPALHRFILETVKNSNAPLSLEELENKAHEAKLNYPIQIIKSAAEILINPAKVISKTENEKYTNI